MIYDVKNETLPREDMERLQLKRLQALCERVYANVPFYKKKFDEKGVKPQDIKSLKDITLLPFTVKQDLRDQYPFGLFAVPKDQIVRIHSSSGTTGTATVVGYTKRDIENWGELMARCFAASGASAADTVHNAYGLRPVHGRTRRALRGRGPGRHRGSHLGRRHQASGHPAEGLRARRSSAAPRPTPCSWPRPAWRWASTSATCPCASASSGPSRGPTRCGWTSKRNSASPPSTSTACPKSWDPAWASSVTRRRTALHIQEDHFLAETIDPVSGEPVEPGEEGELVFTTLTKEGIPLIRYRTRDLTTLNYIPCKCGRTTVRMKRVTGRSDDMLIIRGVNVFPSQIESILIETEGLTPHYQLIVEREGNLDTMEVQVEVTESMFSDEIKSLQRVESKVMKNIKEFLGVTAKVKLVEPKTIERSMGKAKRIIDNRKKD